METNTSLPESSEKGFRLTEFFTNSLMRHLKEASDWALTTLYEGVRERGHTEIRRTHELVIVPMKLEGARLTDIARASAVTKNAVGQLASELEGLGYVRRGDHPDDGRAKLLHFTDQGLELLSDAMAANKDLEAAIETMMGEDKTQQLCALLEELAEKIIASSVDPDGQKPR